MTVCCISIFLIKPDSSQNGFYHDKKGTGGSEEAEAKAGPVTILNVAQAIVCKLKQIISETEATAGKVLQVDNTQSLAKFKFVPITSLEKWFNEYPTHHCAPDRFGSGTRLLPTHGLMKSRKTASENAIMPVSATMEMRIDVGALTS